MKKVYVKPYVLMEDFQLRIGIASCADIIRFSENSCNNDVTPNGGAYNAMDILDNAFTGSSCTEDYNDLFGENEGLCYNGVTSPFSS